MKRILPRLSVCFLALFGATHLDAATWRLSFDVTSSTIGYSELSNRSTGQQLAQGSAEFAAATAAMHAQGAAHGQTGRIRLELETGLETTYGGGSFADGDLMSLTCLSGFLCDLGSTDFLGGAGLFERSYTGGLLTQERLDPTATAYQTGWVFDLASDTGSMQFFDDGAAFGAGLFGGDVLDWINPYGRFEFTNITRTQLIPNPLPAPVFLLGAGLIPLAVMRRKHRRA